MFSLEPCLLLYQLSPSSSCANLHSPLDRGRQRWALWQGSAHLRKLRTHPWYPLITTTPSLREKSQLRRSSWYRVALQWEGHDVYKVSLFLLLFPGHPISDFFFFFFCTATSLLESQTSTKVLWSMGDHLSQFFQGTPGSQLRATPGFMEWTRFEVCMFIIWLPVGKTLPRYGAGDRTKARWGCGQVLWGVELVLGL